MKTPRFSVVIPTRGRADLLPGALRSVLAQTHDDFEVVVSDNASAAAPTDASMHGANGATADAVAMTAGGDARVRLVRTPRALPMHESWAFAIGHARGDFIGVLCDDDALCPRALEHADRVLRRTQVEAIAWRSAALRLPDWPDAAERGRLVFGPPYGDRVVGIDGARLLDLAFDGRVRLTDTAPKLLNGLVARCVLDRARAAGVPPCPPSCPDFGAMVVMAAWARSIALLDAPLLVVGSTPRSVGASSLRWGRAARAFADELFTACPGLVRPLVPGPIASWIGQTLTQAARDVPPLRGRRVNPVHLYGAAAREIDAARRAGFDAGAARAALEAALAGPLADVADDVRVTAREAPIIESEAFLTAELPWARPPGSRRVLGVGPVVPPRRPRVGGRPIDEVAADVEPLLRRHGRPLDRLWAEVALAAGARDVVLYGAGANGRALARLRPTAMEQAWHVADDRPVVGEALVMVGLSAIAVGDLDPRRHFVVVTPEDPEAITCRLRRRGFVEGRDQVAGGAGGAGGGWGARARANRAGHEAVVSG